MSQKQNDTPSFFTKNKLLGIGSIVFASVIISASVFHISNTLSREPVITADINGQTVGALSSMSDMENAYTRFHATLDHATDGAYIPTVDIQYDYTYEKNPVYIDENGCYDALWAQVADDFCMAYMLYVDDKQAAAHEDGEELDRIISSIEDDLLASMPKEYSGIAISNRLRIEKQFCLKSSLKSGDEINELLNPMVNRSADVNEGEEVTVRTASLSVASASFETDLTLDYNLLNTMVITEIIPYETIYLDDCDAYIGTESVMSEGENGVKTVTYELMYDTNGTYIGQNAISETVEVEPTARVILVGTADLPDTEATGNIIWPCNRPKGVSSYYGWRDLYGRPDFHLGIDIPDVKGSAIWAADGGKVLYAGYTPSYGYNVHIEHSNGLSTLYAHLESITVSEGDSVYPGQQIGTMGATGVAYGNHLHFEVRIDNKTVDPMNYLHE